ncbi:MAG: glutathione S-transferase family protein [Halioglobus sp.]|nr:glutathione S-transferase family protein [Halioglobus sp.]
MLKIYHAPFSRSVRILWLAEEIELPYQLESFTLFSEAMQEPAFLKVHPQGKVPAIDDNGFVLWETSAIIEYLAAKYSDGALLPARDTQTGAKALQWMEFAENQLTMIMAEIVAHGGILPQERMIPALVERGNALAPQLIQIVEHALNDKPYILGDNFSVADIMLGFGLNIATYLEFVNHATPNCQAYCTRLAARPAYIKANAV